MASFPTALLFTDIEGSTRLLARDPEGYPVALERHRDSIRSAVRKHGGETVSMEGDSSFSLFPSVADAIECAAAIQHGLRGEQIRVRIGVHCGEVSRTATGLVGIDIHRAARISDAAHGGQVVLSDVAAESSSLPTKDLGWHHLKDLPDPIRLHQLDLEPGREFPPLRTITARTHHLPTHESSFVGRAAEVERLDALLSDSRIVTIVGPGGVGKTRLAAKVAAEAAPAFRDGVWFADLTTVSSPDEALRCINLAIGVDVAGDQEAAFVRATHERQMLILVDNMEHVIDAAATLARAVSASPAVVLLVTSREMLRVSAERLLSLEPLGDEATQLFLARAEEAGARVADQELADVRQICEILDGLPLAIELAASAVRLMGTAAVLRSLSAGVEPVGSVARDAPSRHRRISDTIAWSHDLLTPGERTVFRRMAVCPAPQPLSAILHICADVPEVPAIVGSLLDKSLLVRRTSAADEPRLAMLDLVRRFAAERLRESGELEDVARRHADHWARLSDEIEPGLWSTSTDRIFRSLADQVANLESALEWSFANDPPTGAHIAGGFLYFLVRSASTGTVERWFDAALAVPDLPALTESRIWIARAYWAWGTLTRHEHGQAVERASVAARRSGDERHIVTCEMLRSVAAVGRPEEFEAATTRARAAAQKALEMGLPVLAAQGLNIVGELARNANRLDEAEGAYEEVLDLIEPFGDQLRRRMILANLSFVARRRGDHRRALRLALTTAAASSATVINEASLIAAALPLLELGRPNAACVLYGAALATVDMFEIGWQPSDEAEVVALEGRLRELLTPDQIDSLVAAGRRFAPDQAIEFARSEAAELLRPIDVADHVPSGDSP